MPQKYHNKKITGSHPKLSTEIPLLDIYIYIYTFNNMSTHSIALFISGSSLILWKTQKRNHILAIEIRITVTELHGYFCCSLRGRLTSLQSNNKRIVNIKVGGSAAGESSCRHFLFAKMLVSL